MLMQRSVQRLLKSFFVAGAGFTVFQVTGCTLDPDIRLRAALSAGADLAIFLLDNLVAAI
jgi:hypothetical protein